jgi:hypothetical protein
VASKVVGNLVVRLEAQTERFNRELEKAKRINKRFARQSRLSARAVDSFAKSVRGLIPVLGAAAIVGFARRLADNAQQLETTARRVGLTVEQYSALSFAAERAGVATNVVALATQRFARRIGEVSLGTNQGLTAALQTLDVDLERSGGGLKTNAELLRDFAKALLEVEEPQQRLALATQAFDSEGLQLVELLPQLAGGFDAMGRAAASAGALVDSAANASLARFDRQIRETGQLLGVFASNTAGALLNFLNPDLDSRIDATIERIQSLQQELRNIGPEIERPAIFDLLAPLNFTTDRQDPEFRRELEGNIQFEQALLKTLLEDKRLIEQQDKTAILDADALIDRYQQILELNKKQTETTTKRSPFVFRNDGGLIQFGSDLSRFDAKLTDTQDLIVDGTRSAMGSFVSEVSGALGDAEFRFDRFAQNVTQSLAQIITSQLLTSLLIQPLFGALGIPGFAKGGLAKFASGGLITRPTVFPMANGGIGIAGEAGTEAILPLGRTATGDLGVKAAGSGGGSFAPTVVVNVQQGAGQDASEQGQGISAEVRRTLEELWRTMALREQRPGGVLNPVT